MKAMILAAGRGKRMLPLTVHTPKPLLLFKGERLIVRHLKALARAGISEVVINLGYLGHQIETVLGSGAEWGVSIQYSREDPILETGGGIAQALPLLGTEPFIALSSDLVTDFPFTQLLNQPKELMHLVMVSNPPHHPQGDYALEDGYLVTNHDHYLNFGGIGVYHPDLFQDCPQGSFPLSLLFLKAIKARQATGEFYPGLWHNVGTPEQLAALEYSTDVV